MNVWDPPRFVRKDQRLLINVTDETSVFMKVTSINIHQPPLPRLVFATWLNGGRPRLLKRGRIGHRQTQLHGAPCVRFIRYSDNLCHLKDDMQLFIILLHSWWPERPVWIAPVVGLE